jgi:SAM-dependent methyltransferase
MLPISDRYLTRIAPGESVLEIGCGTWSKVRDHCHRIGANWEGIDTADAYFGRPVIASRIENLADLTLADDTFDWVIGTQTMEHWAENGCSREWGLHQVFRVCKPGGGVLLNVPIYFHGTREFLTGDLETLRKSMSRFSSTVSFETWGRQTEPIPPFFAHPDYKPLARSSAWILDIHAKKDLPLPIMTRRNSPSGRLAELLEYPFWYNVTRVKRRVFGVVSPARGSVGDR